jgi:hypothetical protein
MARRQRTQSHGDYLIASFQTILHSLLHAFSPVQFILATSARSQFLRKHHLAELRATLSWHLRDW